LFGVWSLQLGSFSDWLIKLNKNSPTNTNPGLPLQPLVSYTHQTPAMNKFLYLLLIPSLAFVASPFCGGTYRWDYKILVDPLGAKTVYKKTPVTKSIHALAGIPRPSNAQLGNHRSLPEQQKVKVTALIVGLGQEADGDYHLILTSPDGADSLIAEIPDPSCKKIKGFPGLKKDYTAARTFIEDNIDQTPGSIHYLEEGVKVKITGVVFFDKTAHGNGHAPNGVEIHPVLQIEGE
jgi:hypothetical protein